MRGSDDLVGRADELALLDGLLDGVERGAPAVVLVTGEAGIGKTALLDALTRRAADRGFTTAWGRCAAGGAPPFWPWPRVLRALGGQDQELATATVGDRAGLFAAAADRLEQASTARPVVVAVDDLQWADESCLSLSTFLVAAAVGLRIALAFGVRDEPAELTPALREAMAELPADVLRIPLTGLDRAATGELLGSILGHDPTPEVVGELHTRTGGNALFVKECARLLAAGGASAASVVPDGVRQVITRRVARLSRNAYTVLAAAAVADDFDAALLAGLADLTTAEVAAGLDEGQEARLLALDEDGCRFGHALIRQTLIDTQSAGSRSELHRGAALALEARLAGTPADARAALAERAAHHWAVVPVGGRPRAADLAVEAARSAAGQLGYDHAARLYRWARELGDDSVETLTELGEVEVLAGQLDQGRRTLAVAASRAETERRGEALARAVLSAGSGIGGYEVDLRDEEQLGRLRDSLLLLGEDDSRLRAGVLARIALVDASLPLDRRAAMADGAAAMAARLGDISGEVAALAARCDVLSGPDHLEDRLGATARMVELALRQRDPVIQLVARRHRLLALLEQGELAGVDDELAAYARTSEHLRVPLYSWIVPLWRGMRSLLDGDVAGAAAHADAAEALGRSAGSDNADVMVFTLRFAIARATGSTAAMEDDVERILGDYEGYPPADGMRAVHFVLTDRTEEARRILGRRVGAGLASIPRDSEWLETLWNLGDAAVAAGEHAAVEAVHDALAPYADQWVVDGIGAVCFGPVSDQLRRLRVALDGRDGAPHGAGRSVAPAHDGSAELLRDGPVWHLRWKGVARTVRHSKGVLDIARLVEQPGRELHVLDLVDPSGTAPTSGDAGPVLDDQARRAYKRRLDELDEDIAEAVERADDGRLARLEHERDLLIAELTSAFGLGGRARPANDPAERARKAVGMRIATAIRAITAVHPDLGRHLDRSVITGRYCSYQPESDVVWQVNR